MINSNNSSMLKEYYVNLHTMYNNAVNMLTALNQSLSTTASEISVVVADTNNAQTTVRIPSFIYLENKLEQLDSNFKNLFNMPKSGEAWFNNNANMYKLEMVTANTSPATPKININEKLYANSKYNSLFKDLVNPKTYLKLDIKNLGNNIEHIFMKKYIFYNPIIFDGLKEKKVKTYDEITAALYNYTKGVDYDEYDSILDLPIKKDEFKAEFKILEIPEINNFNTLNKSSNTIQYKNPWEEDGKLIYKVRLDTIKYIDQEDSSIQFSLKNGDFLTLENTNTIYKVKNISSNINSKTDTYETLVTLEEYVGHTTLQSFNENSSMILKLYNNNYSKYNYVEIPLEENPHICVFIGTIYNNIRSILSDAILVDLNTIEMKDENGNFIYDSGNTNKPMTYINYYNKYCKNIGDLLSGFIDTAYPQLSNLSKHSLNLLINSENIQSFVSSTINGTNAINVQCINEHLIDDISSQNILNLHNQKSQILLQLSSLQSNINQVYNQLITTDFNQDVSVTQNALRAKLNEYYTERTELQKQLINIINNINVLKTSSPAGAKNKFRIRGITQTKLLEDYLHKTFNNKCDLIELEVQYKYKSIDKDTTKVTNINESIFTDWNQLKNIEKERKLVFNEETGDYIIKYENYETTNNIIKWNQIDIPIRQGEDVVIKVRYKYSIGQPFIDLYTPWSDELVITFPADLSESTEITEVFKSNNDDVISAKFNETLINEGYQEHITNKIIDNSQTFYHMPENIYSGFNTKENKLISLKDKLNEMTLDLTNYKSLIDNELNSQYKVYIEYDNKSIELSNETENQININDDSTTLNDIFIKKNMNIIIKNTGEIPIKLYSIFPGDINTPLLFDSEQFYDKYILNYERVPVLCGDSNIPAENIYYQTLGQWIYFRQNNPFSGKEYYFNDSLNNYKDIETIAQLDENSSETDHVKYIYDINKYIYSNVQPLLGYRNRISDMNIIMESNIKWKTLTTDSEGNYIINISSNKTNDNIYNTLVNPNVFIPIDKTYNENKYILCYEHICGQDKTPVFLNNKMSITHFINEYKPNNIYSASDLTGAFFIPHLIDKNQLKCNKIDKNQYIMVDPGKSLSIPVDFEYFLTNKKINNSDNQITAVTKTLAFDIRTSLLKNPSHYIISAVANYNYSLINNEKYELNYEQTDKILNK